MTARRSGGVVGVGGASCRWQRPSRIGLGLEYRWGVWLRGEPRISSPSSSSSFYSAMRRGPTNYVGLGTLDQGARTRSEKPLGLSGKRDQLTI